MSPAARSGTAARAARVGALVGLAVVAVLAGAVAGFVHRTTLDVLGRGAPVGLLAGLAALAGLVLAARAVSHSRAGVLLVGAGYAVPVLVLSQFRPEGDLVIAEDVWGLTLLAGTALIITVGVTVPLRAYSRTAADVDDEIRAVTART